LKAASATIASARRAEEAMIVEQAQSKKFFFEKKNQKTFGFFDALCGRVAL
jgi:hypothetical protein